MDFTGRMMKGFLFIDPAGLEAPGDLKRWLDLGLEFAVKGELKTAKKKKSQVPKDPV